MLWVLRRENKRNGHLVSHVALRVTVGPSRGDVWTQQLVSRSLQNEASSLIIPHPWAQVVVMSSLCLLLDEQSNLSLCLYLPT